MQFKVPQNVEIEDKIFAFVSFKQLFILLGGGGISYLIYVGSVDRYDPSLFMIPIALVVLLTIAIAFFRMENITFIKLVLLILESFINPRTRFWHHYAEPLTQLNVLQANLELAKSGVKQAPKQKGSGLKSLSELTDIVDESAKKHTLNN